MIPNQLLLYCRPGFESDLAGEIFEKAASLGYAGHCIVNKNDGYVRFVLMGDIPGNELHQALPLHSLVFARQSLVALAPLEALSREDRLSPIVEQVVASGWSFETLWQETPDTNEAKALAGLLKALQRPLESVLRRRGALRRKAGGRRLHLFWTQGDQVQLGMSFPGNRSEYPGGVKRLRFPYEAPSRSTLKLEEAWHVFVPRDEWSTRICQGMQAADLGAAPGGWTYQLVRQGLFVFAIDNGPMDKTLMTTGQVEHLREDGFVWEPPQKLEWLVCDIVDKPMRVITMVERWLVRRWCKEAIFNLKLPMKQRWEEVRSCLARLEKSLTQAGVASETQCKQLYHDREEVTVHVRLRD
ncbi:23S rRNA (cytidine(2498)-2'-O)-methyltransferase RlmM [Halomonas sp. GXIMD04776]|uniref:23S rRNA (cytidine(2498)-2'-O)-methyltransferase RlmM n=1 Tax=Halomonas sp. GXIMD04776 TaxID=3415605 RepID=UPI003C94EC1D